MRCLQKNRKTGLELEELETLGSSRNSGIKSYSLYSLFDIFILCLRIYRKLLNYIYCAQNLGFLKRLTDGANLYGLRVLLRHGYAIRVLCNAMQ